MAGQKDRYTEGRQTNGLIDGWMEEQKDEWTEGQMDRKTDEQKERCIGGLVDRRTNGQNVGQT